MDARNDPTPEESADILKGLKSSPVPEGMASRAVARWAEEQAAQRDRRARPTLWLRPAVGLAAATLLVALVYRQGGIHPTATESSPVVGGPTRTADVTPPGGAMKAAPPAPEASAALQERASAPAAPGPRIAAAPLRANAAAREQIAARVPSQPVSDEARAGMEIGVRMMVGSSADLAYLNGAVGEAATPPESPGAVPDTRLLNTVTLAEEGLGMADLVGVLRERTGVDIALPDQAARDALAVYCTDKPLREVLRQMARALDLQWTRAGAGDASRYRAVLRVAPTPEAEEAAKPPAMMLDGATGAPAPAVGRSAKGEMADAQARRAGGAPRPEPDVSIIGDPERVRAVLGRARGGRVALGAAPLQTEGWLILRTDR